MSKTIFILRNIAYFTKYLSCIISFDKYVSAKDQKVKSDTHLRMSNQLLEKLNYLQNFNC